MHPLERVKKCSNSILLDLLGVAATDFPCFYRISPGCHACRGVDVPCNATRPGTPENAHVWKIYLRRA